MFYYLALGLNFSLYFSEYYIYIKNIKTLYDLPYPNIDNCHIININVDLQIFLWMCGVVAKLMEDRSSNEKKKEWRNVGSSL